MGQFQRFRHNELKDMQVIKLAGDLLADFIKHPALLSQALLPLIGLRILDCQYSLPSQSEQKILILLTECAFSRTLKIEDTNHFFTITQRHIQFRDVITDSLDVPVSPL